MSKIMVTNIFSTISNTTSSITNRVFTVVNSTSNIVINTVDSLLNKLDNGIEKTVDYVIGPSEKPMNILICKNCGKSFATKITNNICEKCMPDERSI